MTIQKPEEFVRIMSGFYKRSWLEWDAPILEATLIKNFNYDPTEQEMDQIEAVRSLLQSDEAFNDPLLFENVVMSLAGTPVVAETWQRAEPKEIALGIYLMRKIAGSKPFGRSVRAYIAAALFHEDLHIAPASLHLDPGAKFLRSLSQITDPEIKQLESIVDDLKRAKTPDARARLVIKAPDSDGDFLRRQAAELGEIVQFLLDNDAK